MKTLHLYLSALFICSALFIQAQWITQGNAATPGSAAGATNITFSAGGTPYVYYYDANNAVPVALKYDGANWDSLGSGLAQVLGVSNGFASDFALAPDSVAYIACAKRSGSNDTLIVLSCDTGVWSVTGSTGVPAFIEVAVAVDGNNNPYVAYTKAPSASTPNYFDSCIVITYSNGNWTQLGSPFPAQSISIAIYNNVPYVLYSDSNNYCNLVQFTGGAWVNVGAPAFSIQGVSGSSMQIGADGTVYVAYSDSSAGPLQNSLSVVKYDGSAWTNIGSPQFATGQIKTHHALAVDASGHLFVTYTASNAVSVMANFATPWAWFNVGTVNLPGSYSDYSSVALNPAGVPFIAYDSSAFSIATVKDYAGIINSIDKVTAAPIQIYPNPTSNILFVNLPPAQTGTLNLYDLTGKLVLQLQQNQISNQRIDLSPLAPGMYTLAYTGNGNSLYAKVIKE
jgi:hypothetical protein